MVRRGDKGVKSPRCARPHPIWMKSQLGQSGIPVTRFYFAVAHLIDILARDGLSKAVLESLSFRSELGISLKKDLRYFPKEALFDELDAVRNWYVASGHLDRFPVDSRIKSRQSARLKYARYYPDHQARKVFNDLLGFRSMCDTYDDVMDLMGRPLFRVADLSSGKALDDGYRGVHVYFQLSSRHYPIEIQYNTFYDRQLNNWLHKYLYKRIHDVNVGYKLRMSYESGDIKSEEEFRRRMNDVLSGC